MIDIHQLRHYVKAMSRARKSLARSLVLAALLALALVSSGAWAGALADANPGNPGQTLDDQLPVSQGQNHPDRFLQPLLPPVRSPGPAHGETGEKAPGSGH